MKSVIVNVLAAVYEWLDAKPGAVYAWLAERVLRLMERVEG